MCDKIKMDIRSILDLIVRSIQIGRADNALAIAESAIEQIDKRKATAEAERLCDRIQQQITEVPEGHVEQS